MTRAISAPATYEWPPKFNRYFSTAQQSLVLEKKHVLNRVQKAKGPVPLFKNPNSPIILSSCLWPIEEGTDQSLDCCPRSCDRKINQTQSNNLYETYKSFNLALGTHSRSYLVFLNKKGSQTPNPNLISYKFRRRAAGGATPPVAEAVKDGYCNASSCHNPVSDRNIQDNVYKLLSHFFKSMYCLISKPVFIETPDKIKIQLFYFLCLPKILTDNNLLQPTISKQTSRGLALSSSGSGSALNGAHNNPAQSKIGGTSLNLSMLNLKNLDNNASVFKNKKNFIYGQRLQHKLKIFNSKNLNVKFNLIKLSQSSGSRPFCLKLPALVSDQQRLTNVYPKKFKLICRILSKLFNKSVELELIRLHQPYYDSNILVNFLALIINKKNIGAAIQRIFNSNIVQASLVKDQTHQLPQRIDGDQSKTEAAEDFNPANKTGAYLSGLNIKISGRLMREPIIPRITTKKFDKGFTAKGKINYLDVARFTHKNRKGAFTITVKSGQNFI